MSKLLTTIQISTLFALLIIPAIIYKQYWLAGMFFVFGVCFGIGEALAVKFTGLSISQHFWLLKDTNFQGALIVSICMLIAWIILLIHFMVK
jgi:hypothetical protein